MRRLRAGFAVAALVLLAAPAFSATWSWQRELEFAKALTTRQYYDIADLVIERLQQKSSIIGIEKAFLFRELGEYYSDLAQTVVTEKRDVEGFIKYLDLSRAFFLKFLDHPSIKKNPRYGGNRFEIRLRLSRIQLAVAEGHARKLDDDRVNAADKAKHKTAAINIFRAAIGEFEKAVAEKSREVAKVKGLSPPANADSKLRDAYKTKYRAVREEHFRVRLERNMAQVRFAALLKKVNGPGAEIQSNLNAAEKDYRQLLLDFSGTPGATQANLELARCLIAKGVRHDKEAIERLGEVWEKRINFGRFKRVPCEAAQLKVTILLRQRRGREVVGTCDEILEFASNKVWGGDQKSVQGVINTFEAVPESDREQFDQRAVAQTFMMEAEGYALQGEGAETAKKPRREIRRYYSAAYDIALGVLEVRRFLDPKYSSLVEKWRVKANRPVAPAIVRQRYLDAINKKKFDVAATLYREIASAQTLLPPDKLSANDKRQMWFTVGQCYHAAGREHEAAIAFLAAGRWFPEPTSEAYKAASAAISAAHAQHKRTQDPNDEKFLRWIQLQAEALNPYGKGGIYIRQAENARNEGQLDRALDLLAEVSPDQDAYPHALYHYALTYKAVFRALKPDEQKGPAGRRAIASMKTAFSKLFDYFRAKAPDLKAKGEDEAVERLINIVGAAVAMYTDFYLRDPVKDPKVVLALTDDLTKSYPGIEKTPGYPVVIFSRMRAAYSLIPSSDPAAGAKLLATIEAAWKLLGTFPDFRYLDKAAAMAAQSNIVMAKNLETRAKTAAAAEKATLTRQAGGYRTQAIEYYLQLIDVAPRQSLRTYRYILYSLKTRANPRKGDDWNRIIKIAPKIIDLFKRDPGAEEDLLFVKSALGIAYAERGRHAEAIKPLEEVDDVYEKRYQDAYLPWRKRKHAYDQDPENAPKPGRPPKRSGAQPEIMEKLAFCYLKAKASDKYERALRTYITLTRLYQRQPEKYWSVFYNLCMTYQRLGRYEDAAKQIDRAWRRDPTLGGRKSQFRDLVAAIQKSLGRLQDARRKAELERFITRLLADLRK